MKDREIDIREGESFAAYSDRKDAEWLEAMQGGLRGEVSIQECAAKLADAIDASILAKYGSVLPPEAA
jgi:hypothetical protein